MTIIAARFNFEREAGKAAARVLAHQGASGSSGGGAGQGGLRQPLLDGAQCERLERGLLGGAPEGPEEEGVEEGLLDEEVLAGASADAAALHV